MNSEKRNPKLSDKNKKSLSEKKLKAIWEKKIQNENYKAIKAIGMKKSEIRNNARITKKNQPACAGPSRFLRGQKSRR